MTPFSKTASQHYFATVLLRAVNAAPSCYIAVGLTFPSGKRADSPPSIRVDDDKNHQSPANRTLMPSRPRTSPLNVRNCDNA